MPGFDVVVVGSFMQDLVARVPHWPRPGETVLASEFGLFQGGKGGNQAIAAARAGARVAMIGRLGADVFGDSCLRNLAAEGIADGGIVRDGEEGTGIAIPILNPLGENMIIVAPRANMRLSVDDVQAAAGVIGAGRVLLLQMETPLAASLAAARLARAAGAAVVWNVAPAAPLPHNAFALCTVMVVNEGEAATLTGADTSSFEGCRAAARAFRERGAGSAIVTLGAGGVLWADAAGEGSLPAHTVKVVDSTGAGDAFCGALAAALARGEPLARVIASGNAAGALAVGKLGAAASLPRADEIAALLAETGMNESGRYT